MSATDSITPEAAQRARARREDLYRQLRAAQERQADRRAVAGCAAEPRPAPHRDCIEVSITRADPALCQVCETAPAKLLIGGRRVCIRCWHEAAEGGGR